MNHAHCLLLLIITGRLRPGRGGPHQGSRGPGAGPPTLRQEFFAPTGRGTLEIRPDGLKGLRVHINGTYNLSLAEADLAGDVARLDVTQYLQAGANAIQYNPVGRGGSATVLVIVD